MKIRSFLKKRKKLVIVSSIVLVLLILIIAKVSASKNAKPAFEHITVAKSDIVQEVDATGRVKPAEAIDFSFETSGKVASVKVKVGDKVKSGQTLATLKNNDLSASVSQASAGVESARSSVAQYQAMVDTQKIKLEELKKGARPEEIQLTQIKVDNAKKSLEDAEKNLEQTKARAESDLNQIYIDCANSAVGAVNTGLNSLNIITDIQYAHFNGNDQDASVIAGAKEQAVSALVGQINGGRWTFQFINNSYGGARASASLAQTSPTEANALKALNDASMALSKIKTNLDVIPYNTNVLTATEKANITSERATMNAQMSTISAKTSSISAQKNTNDSLILSAQNQVNQAQNGLTAAEQELALKKLGATSEQIQTQEAAIRQAEANLRSATSQVKSAQASLASASAMLSKSVITSSINGTVTKVDVKVGEMSSMSAPAISVMSDAKFSMEANIPEADIAKVKVDNIAKVTLDAYGADMVFDAKIVKIDPAETVVDGVSTYKTTFEFTADDEKIKSGMTANITIMAAKAEGVLVIPQRSVIKKDGKSFVLVSDDEKTTREFEIEVGLVGSGGNVEVMAGLKEGERIINPSSLLKK